MFRGDGTDCSAARRRTRSRCTYQLLLRGYESLVAWPDTGARDGVLVVSCEGLGAWIRGDG